MSQEYALLITPVRWADIKEIGIELGNTMSTSNTEWTFTSARVTAATAAGERIMLIAVQGPRLLRDTGAAALYTPTPPGASYTYNPAP